MTTDVSFNTFFGLITLGLLSGTLGGMLGVGGSVVMIPGLTMTLGYNQHVYQAAAMITNVVVSVPAALRHRAAGALVLGRLRWMVPTALLCAIGGVWLSNLSVFHGQEGGRWLGRLLAVFLVYVVADNVRRLCKAPSYGRNEQSNRPISRVRYAAVGSVTGAISGLLGIGGGSLAVPLQQAWLGLPLRQCIANSSTLICITAAVGAFYKNASLDIHGQSWKGSFALALLLAPSCWLGGHLGANLTHRMPLVYVRVIFISLMTLAAVKMAAIPWETWWFWTP